MLLRAFSKWTRWHQCTYRFALESSTDYKTLAGFAFLWKSKENKLGARQETPDAKRSRRVPGPGKKIGRPWKKPRLTAEEFEAMVQEQSGMCALCSDRAAPVV